MSWRRVGLRVWAISGVAASWLILAASAMAQAGGGPANTPQANGGQAGGQPQQPQFAIEGQKLLREGKVDEALEHYKKVLQTSPESIIANNGVGVALDLKGQYKDARKYFQRAIEVATIPQDKAIAQRSMAMSYAFEGDCKKASEWEQKVFDYWVAQKKFFDQGEAANEAARVCIDSGDLDTAEKWYRKGHDAGLKEPDIKPERADLWAFRWEHAQARLAARRGKIDEAQEHVVKAKEILDKGTNPQQKPFFPYLVGYVAFYAGDYHAALNAFTGANQNDPFIQTMIGETYEKMGDQDKAAPFFAKAAATTAHNPAGAYAHRIASKKAP